MAIPGPLVMNGAGQDQNGTQSASESTFDWKTRYELTVPEDTVVQLNHLCAKCEALRQKSAILDILHENKQRPRERMIETFDYGSFSDLQSSYLGDCHLCALLWYSCTKDPEALPEVSLDAKLTAELVLKPNLSDDERLNQLFNKFVTASTMIRSDCAAELRLISSDIFRSKDAVYIMPTNQRALGCLREWFSYCLSEHEECRKYQDAIASDTHPSRILDLRQENVRLMTSASSIEGISYMTLSHRWGNPSKIPQLTKQNLPDFEVSIRLNSLPYTFRDAINLTLALGCEYLWIDSLCIIQDSKEDWVSEGAKMAAIYGESVCNISYVGCSSDTLELPTASKRDPRILTPCMLCQEGCLHKTPKQFGPPEADDRGPYQLIAQTFEDKKNLGLVSSSFQGPLFQRAWVFQETLLCPRTIYYGGPQLMFECSCGFNSEFIGDTELQLDGQVYNKQMFYQDFDLKGKSDDENEQRLQQLMSAWYAETRLTKLREHWSNLVSRYLATNLTYETDRVVALNGVTEAVQKLTGFTAVCGFWLETFAADMCWVRTPEANDKKRWDLSFEVPSWSWYAAAFYGRSSRSSTGMLSSTSRERGLWQVASKASQVFCACKANLLYTARFASCTMLVVTALPPFNRFSGAKLCLQTFICHSYLIWTNEKPTLYPPPDILRLELEYWPDENILPAQASEYPKHVAMVLLIDWADIEPRNYRCQMGLVISHVVGECWRRVGFFRSAHKGDSKVAQVPSLQIPTLINTLAMTESQITLI